MAKRGGLKTELANKMLNDWLKWVVPKLADEGENIIIKAYEDSNSGTHNGLNWLNVDENGLPKDYPSEPFSPPNWKNVSGNLRDAYGSAVYIYGKLQSSTMRFAGAATASNTYAGDHHDHFEGREAIISYLKGFKANTKSVLTLVCANAAPYASALEDGDTWGGNKYVVMSHISDDIYHLFSKFGNNGDFRFLKF